MSFTVAAASYDRFMGRYSVQLSAGLADLAGVQPRQRAVDIGCGPGALTAELVQRLGAENVAAADPSEPFVAAARARNPGVDVHTWLPPRSCRSPTTRSTRRSPSSSSTS